MKFNKWTLGLAAVGAVSLTSVVQAEEKQTPILTALSSTVISGYVDTAIHWNPGSKNAAGDPAYAFAAGKSDGFNLNVVKLSLSRPLDEADWSAGYKVDLLFGPDATGYNPSSNSAGTADFAIKQAYVALRAPVGNGLDFKVGVWDTIIGYEVFESGNNPNYTRSYGYTIEPTQHTGILASYQINEHIGVSAGVANTLSAGINAKPQYNAVDPRSAAYKTYMGSITLSAPDSFGPLAGATLYAGVVHGFNAALVDGQVNWYAGVTVPTPIDGLRFGGSFDYAGIGGNSNFPGGGGIPSGYAKSFALYASYQATEKLSLHARAEYFNVTSAAELAAAGTGTSGIAREIFAATATLQYDLWANVLSRLEIRWDNAMRSIPTSSGGTGGEVFGSSDNDAILVAANIVYKF